MNFNSKRRYVYVLILFSVLPFLYFYLAKPNQQTFEQPNEIFIYNSPFTTSEAKRETLVVLCVMGTRPEAIKMAPLIWELKKRKDKNIYPIVCVTGQHKDLITSFLKLFELEVHIFTNLMVPGQTLSQLTVRGLRIMDQVLKSVKPDLVLVQGDTTTALCASLASFYNNVPIGHVEAGLRTYRLYEPFPEEFNRQLISTLASFHFAPTARSARYLLKEGIPSENLFVTGNTVIDSLLWVLKLPISSETRSLIRNFNLVDVLDKVLKKELRMILLTAHRRENHGPKLKLICQAIVTLVTRNPNLVFVFPVHPNPEVKKAANSFLENVKNVFLIPSLGYEQLAFLMNHSEIIITDSGGLQEEASVLSKPVLVLRDHTERPEGVEEGVSKLVGTDPEFIVKTTESLLNDQKIFAAMSRKAFPYGNGTSALQIVDIIESQFKRIKEKKVFPGKVFDEQVTSGISYFLSSDK